MNLAVKPCHAGRKGVNTYYGYPSNQWYYLRICSPSITKLLPSFYAAQWNTFCIIIVHQDMIPLYFDVCHLQVEHLVVNCSSSVALKSQSLTLCSKKLHVDASIFCIDCTTYEPSYLDDTHHSRKMSCHGYEWHSHIHSMQHRSIAVLPVCNTCTQQRIYIIYISVLYCFLMIECMDPLGRYNDVWALSKLAFS